MTYKVVHPFCDLMDDRHVYTVGDVYPRDGKKATKRRIDELSTTKNRIGVILIMADVPDKEEA